MEIKEWLDHEVTKYVLKELDFDRLFALESILSSSDKEESCGIVKGLSRALHLIRNLEGGL